ncbi:MAG: hypothetical protein WA982_16770, partial [Rubrobacteraceae bacterium]
MRTLVLLSLLPILLMVSTSCASPSEASQDISEVRPVVLILIEDLTWEEVRETSSLADISDSGTVANLSTFQGASPADSRMGYVLLGAGVRVDTSLLPESLPKDPTEFPEAFRGPATAVQSGSLGEALSEAEIKTATIGENALLVAMDSKGQVSLSYNTSEPIDNLEKALTDDADFVAVQAGSTRQAGRLAEVAGEAGAKVAVA